jgi:hypothetical protein
MRAQSNSYYPSYAETYITVEEAQSPAQPIQPEPTPAEPVTNEFKPTPPEQTEPIITKAAEAQIITTELAILAAVVVACVIGVVNLWALRKRK